jgi:hypothetical protein
MRHISNGVSTFLQLVILAIPTVLNHVFKSSDRILWACDDNDTTIWHVGFLCPIPIVGLTWFYFLRWTYDMKVLRATNRQLVVYYRRRWVDDSVEDVANLLPGFAQVLMTVYFTFLFSTLYGISVKVALVRVVFVATFLFISRVVSCENKSERTGL